MPPVYRLDLTTAVVQFTTVETQCTRRHDLPLAVVQHLIVRINGQRLTCVDHPLAVVEHAAMELHALITSDSAFAVIE